MRLILVFTLFGICSLIYSQQDTVQRQKVYKMNYWADVSMTLANFTYNQIVFERISNKYVDTLEILSLDANDINSFDRVATRMDLNFVGDAAKYSDQVRNATILLPFLLAFDKEIRKDWYDIFILYAEAHSFNMLAYSVIGPNITDRYRPVCYYDEVPIETRASSGNMNSFFSGHTSATATGSFFMAKVYSDYHPELGNKKYYLFAAAAIPPAIVGYYRIKATKHYPTDVIMGFSVGAACGILVPHFHKMKKNDRLSLVPYSGESTGLYLSYKF